MCSPKGRWEERWLGKQETDRVQAPCSTGSLFPRPQSSRPGPPRSSPLSAPWGSQPWPSPGVLQRGFPCLPSWALYRGKNRQTERQGAGPVTCQSGQDTGVGVRPGAAPRVEIRSAVRGGAERTPLRPRPPWWGEDSERGGSSSVSSVGVPGRTRGPDLVPPSPLGSLQLELRLQKGPRLRFESP